MPSKQINDFRPEEYTRRFETLEEFKKELEGANFYKRVAEAVTESTTVQKAIGDAMWDKFRSRFGILLLGALGVIVIGFLTRLPDILIAWGSQHNVPTNMQQGSSGSNGPIVK